jgi:hypothetical protein
VVITSAAPPGQLRPGAGQRLAAFAELVANATVNAQARGGRRAIAAEQAALRRLRRWSPAAPRPTIQD